MFDRFVRMAQARGALRAGDLERGLRLLGDPVLDPEHRKVRELRGVLIEGLLDRAQRLVAAGRHQAAEGALEAILAAEAGHERARDALRSCREQRSAAAQRTARIAAASERARLALARGDLEAARRLAGELDEASRDEFLAQVGSQRQVAAAAVQDVESGIASLGFDAALAKLRGARGLDREVPIGGDVQAALAQALAQELASQPGPARAVRLAEAVRSAADLAPQLAVEPSLAPYQPAVDREPTEGILKALEDGDTQRAVERASSPTAALQISPAVLAAVDAARRGAFDVAARALDSEVPQSQRAEVVQRLFERRAADAARRVDAAREAIQQGRLGDARVQLLELLEECPGHEGARGELLLLDQGADARAQLMVEARALARSKQLAAAAARVVPIAMPGPEGDEARLLLRELQPQLDLVRRGVDQVQASLHGPDTESVEGLRGCLRRLGQLAEVQADSADVARLTGSIEAEIAGVESFDEVAEAVSVGDPRRAGEALARFVALRGRLLAVGRLDARAERAVEAILGAAEAALAVGRCAEADAWLAELDVESPGGESLRQRVRALRGEVTGRRVRAAHEARVADQLANVERDLAGAEEAIERARKLAADEPSVRRVSADLERAADQLRRVESIGAVGDGAGPEDVSEARRALTELGPTPPAMRTRVFDLKRNLARAQGLEGAFLLRVDEAGEFLVFRQESATLGHIRDRGCDLPLQARLASRHARLCRTMSFHGGQVDEVVAERGPVVVDGVVSPKIKLTDGLCFGLGDHVRMRYRLPSSRSLTARLDLMGGVELGGAQALLWMKDRGRDGRILIGPGSDAHVRVASATGTVELFAGNDGRIRVRAEGGGAIDGAPFEGEHPVAGGAFVSSQGVGFSVQPWSPADATAPPG